MLGGIIFGNFSDKFGRKNIMLICLYTQCVIGIALHFVRRLVVFMGLRCIQGVFIQVSNMYWFITLTYVLQIFVKFYESHHVYHTIYLISIYITTSFYETFRGVASYIFDILRYYE